MKKMKILLMLTLMLMIISSASSEPCETAEFDAKLGRFNVPAEPQVQIQVEESASTIISVHFPISKWKSSAFFVDFAEDNEFGDENQFNQSFASFPFRSSGFLDINEWIEPKNEWKAVNLSDCGGIVLSRNFSVEELKELRNRGEMNWTSSEASLFFSGRLYIHWIALSPFGSPSLFKVATWRRDFQVELGRGVNSTGSAPIDANFDSTLSVSNSSTAVAETTVTLTQSIPFGPPYGITFYNVILCHGIKDDESCGSSSNAVYLVKEGVISDGVNVKTKKANQKLELTFSAPGPAEKNGETNYRIEVDSKLNYNDKTSSDSVDIRAKASLYVWAKPIGDSRFVLGGLTPVTATVLVGIMVIFIQFNPTAANRGAGGMKKGLRFGGKGGGALSSSLASQGAFNNSMASNMDGRGAIRTQEPAGSFASSTYSDADYKPGYK